tara:strand:- start:588 stop:869 length:282 start_codon:yes stop_codon:yes gene_type:complete
MKAIFELYIEDSAPEVEEAVEPFIKYWTDNIKRRCKDGEFGRTIKVIRVDVKLPSTTVIPADQQTLDNNKLLTDEIRANRIEDGMDAMQERMK